jgi:hypothetical protein
MATAIVATKEEETVSIIQYAWGANCPIKGTTGLMMDIDTEQAFEFSVTYELLKKDGPTWVNLWEMMMNAIKADGIILPACVSHERLDYMLSCETVNQSVHIMWRQKLPDGSTPRIPQDHGLPVYTVYGVRAELKMRDIERLGCGVAGIVQALYGGGLEVVQVPSQKWSFNAAMGKPGEYIGAPDEVVAEIQGNPTGIPGFNEGLRESAEIVVNVDKGFVHFIEQFRNDRAVTASRRVEKGHQGEYGWGVYFEQGRHRCILAGTLSNRPGEDELWTASAEWANFEPVLGQLKIHQERLWTPEEFAHIFEDETYSREPPRASEFRKRQMDRFMTGIRKFGQGFEWHPRAESDPPKKADYYSYHAAASTRIRVSDGPELWSQGQVVFAPPVSQSETPGTSPQATAQQGWFSSGDELLADQKRLEQDQAFPRRTSTGTMFSPFLEDSR